nr:histidine phosphatase family protein [Pseudomonas sp.]
MNLILWRHAEAEDGSNDMERKLTSRGHKQAEMSAKWLRKHAPGDLCILVSPAKRTRQTADALDMKYDIVPEIAPGATPEILLQAAKWPEGEKNVLVVGHQPTLGAAIRLMLTGTSGPWTVRKSGVWWLARRERGDDSQVVVRAVIDTDHL